MNHDEIITNAIYLKRFLLVQNFSRVLRIEYTSCGSLEKDCLIRTFSSSSRQKLRLRITQDPFSVIRDECETKTFESIKQPISGLYDRKPA